VVVGKLILSPIVIARGASVVQDNQRNGLARRDSTIGRIVRDASPYEEHP
jgi:hypothetical protein